MTPYEIALKAPIALITGPNGAGKTTILEALYYACYLRSFRTYVPRELIHFDQASFIINISFNTYIEEQPIHHDLHIGFDSKKKLVKIDGKAIQTYKDLLDYYRIISITTDDMQLITGNPQERRTFVDQALSLINPDYVTELRAYKVILSNKNALLRQGITNDSLYHLWNEQLWQKTYYIQKCRKELLEHLQHKTNSLLSTFFGESFVIDIEYKASVSTQESYADFINFRQDLFIKEQIMQRSLFGVHLDDILIRSNSKRSKIYASRGQQKLTVCILKLALVQHIVSHKGKIVLLLDDFMGDFDSATLDNLYRLLKHLDCQLIFTSPTANGYLENKLLENGGQEIGLTPRKL